MNWLLIIVLLIIFFSVWRGWRLGLLRVLYSLVSVVLVIILVAYAAPYISNFLKNNTSLYSIVQEKSLEHFEQRIDNASEGDSENPTLTEIIGNLSLPQTVTSYLGTTSNEKNGVATQTVKEALAESMANNAATLILGGISFFAALILVLILVRLIGHVLDIVNHIPVLSGINRFLGLFAGGFEGLILVWLLMMVILLLSGTGVNTQLTENINKSAFLTYLYEHNWLLNLLTKFLKR